MNTSIEWCRRPCSASRAAPPTRSISFAEYAGGVAEVASAKRCGAQASFQEAAVSVSDGLEPIADPVRILINEALAGPALRSTPAGAALEAWAASHAITWASPHPIAGAGTQAEAHATASSITRSHTHPTAWTSPGPIAGTARHAVTRAAASAVTRPKSHAIEWAGWRGFADLSLTGLERSFFGVGRRAHDYQRGQDRG